MEATKELSEYLFERDRQEFSLGDTLDIKTGLLLASLTFLAIQSGDLIGKHLPPTQLYLQYGSIAFTVLGGILCAIVLWPRTYMTEAMPDEYEAWIDSLEEYRKLNPGEDAGITLSQARFSMAKQRIQTNAAINEGKSAFMFRAFYCVMAAFIANVATLAIHLF